LERDADVATIAHCILGTLKYEPHTADTTVLRRALEGVIEHITLPVVRPCAQTMVSQSTEEYDAEIREWAKRQAEWDKPGWDVWGTRWEWRRRKTTPFARPTGQRHDRDLHQDRHGRPHREPTGFRSSGMAVTTESLFSNLGARRE
jgi:hypothetical protein